MKIMLTPGRKSGFWESSDARNGTEACNALAHILLNETLTAKMSGLQRTLSSCASSQSTLSLLQSLDHLRWRL